MPAGAKPGCGDQFIGCATEALACGTPVIAFPNDWVLAEIVEHGSTGFLVNDLEEMAKAITAASSIDPVICRARARNRFSARRMTREYINLYKSMAAGCYVKSAGRSSARPTSKQTQTLEVVSNSDQIKSIILQWLALWRKRGVTPFQSPPLAARLVETFGSGRAPVHWTVASGRFGCRCGSPVLWGKRAKREARTASGRHRG